MSCVENQPFHSWMARTDFTSEKPENTPVPRGTPKMRVPQISPLFPGYTTGTEEDLDLQQFPATCCGDLQHSPVLLPNPTPSLQPPQSSGLAGIGVGLWGHCPREAQGCSSHSMCQLDIPTSIIMKKQLAISIYSSSLPLLIKTTPKMAIKCA